MRGPPASSIRAVEMILKLFYLLQHFAFRWPIRANSIRFISRNLEDELRLTGVKMPIEVLGGEMSNGVYCRGVPSHQLESI